MNSPVRAFRAVGGSPVFVARAEGAFVFGADGRAYLRGLAHRAKLDNNAELAKFATTLEKVAVATVESGFMTKDLALLVGPDQKWLTTTAFLDKVSANLQAAMA